MSGRASSAPCSVGSKGRSLAIALLPKPCARKHCTTEHGTSHRYSPSQRDIGQTVSRVELKKFPTWKCDFPRNATNWVSRSEIERPGCQRLQANTNVSLPMTNFACISGHVKRNGNVPTPATATQSGKCRLWWCTSRETVFGDRCRAHTLACPPTRPTSERSRCYPSRSLPHPFWSSSRASEQLCRS